MRKSIDSVLGQTYSNWELIVVDDDSSDDSLEIINEYSAKDNRIKVFSLNKNSGAAIARNKAIEQASGRYIAFLDSDDIWLNDKLESQISFMSNNNIKFCYSGYDKIDEYDQVIGTVGIPSKVSYSDLLKTCYIGCLTVIYDADYFGKVYMPLIRKRQDYALWLTLLKKVDFAYGYKSSTAKYRVHSDSISANKFNASTYTWRVYRDIEKLSFIRCVYSFAHYAVRGLLRQRYPKLAKLLGVMHS